MVEARSFIVNNTDDANTQHLLSIIENNHHEKYRNPVHNHTVARKRGQRDRERGLARRDTKRVSSDRERACKQEELTSPLLVNVINNFIPGTILCICAVLRLSLTCR